MTNPAMKKTDRSQWSRAEDQILIANKDLTNADIAALLPRRSTQAIKNRRLRIKPNPMRNYKAKVRSLVSIERFKASMAAGKAERTAKATEARQNWPRITTKAADVLGPLAFAY